MDLGLLRSLFCSLLLSLSCASAWAVVYVKADAVGANNGSSWSDAYTDLQAALAVTDAGDIWVAAGTYYPGPAGNRDATFQLKNKVRLYGGFAGTETGRNQRDWIANETILSGDIDQDGTVLGNSFHVVTASNTRPNAVIDGFTVKQGGFSGFGTGMTMVKGSATVTHMVFRDNFGDACGVYLHDASPHMQFVSFIDNWGRYTGAGLCADSALTLTDVEFIGNEVRAGGTEASGAGLYYNGAGTLSITRGKFINNRATQYYPRSDFQALGGGALILSGDFVIRDSVFQNNRAQAGGGLFVLTEGSIINTLFSGNSAYPLDSNGGITLGNYGGAIAMVDYGHNKVSLLNSVLADNTAGEGGGIATYVNAQVDIRNSILWHNTATGIGISTRAAQVTGKYDVSYSIVEGLLSDPTGGGPYPGASEADPRFVNLAAGNFRLRRNSPAIDAGNNADLPATVTTDLARRLRRADAPDVADSGAGTAPIVDMGAYEFAAAKAPASVDLLLGMTDTPDPVTAGDLLTYKLSVTNIGTRTAGQVRVDDNVPLGATLKSAVPSVGVCRKGATVQCALGSLPAAATATIQMTVEAIDPGTLNNYASASTSSSDVDLGNNDVSELTEVLAPVPTCSGGTGQLTVYTLDENAAGVANTQVTVTGPGGCVRSGNSSIYGQFKLKNLPLGDYTVTPALSGCPFVPSSSLVSVNPSANVTFVGDGCN